VNEFKKQHNGNLGSIKVKFDDQNIEDFLTLRPLARSIIQSLPVGVVIFDSDLLIIESNSEAKNLLDLDDYIDKSLAKCGDSPGKTGLYWAQQIKSVLATGKTKSFDGVSYVSSGKVKLLRIVCTPIGKSKTQKNLGGSILIEDITEKVGIQRELTDAERLAAIGRHTSKIAHELSSPLDGILRYVSLAARIVEQENLTKPKEYLDRCRQALLRMVQIVSELLEFSRSSYESLERASIEQIIEDAVKIISAKTEASNIKISRNCTSGIPKIRNGNLFQIFCNIIKNAFEAMPQGGELHISTRLAKDNTVVAEFRDTGNGFAPENAEMMFEPFFTTKEKGTGLGLAICRDIVDRYHGRITAENAPQGGSIFTVCLPLDGIL